MKATEVISRLKGGGTGPDGANSGTAYSIRDYARLATGTAPSPSPFSLTVRQRKAARGVRQIQCDNIFFPIVDFVREADSCW